METFASAVGREMHHRSPCKEGLYLSCGKCCQQTASSCQQVQGLFKRQGAASFVWGQALLAGSLCQGPKGGGAATASHVRCCLDSYFPGGRRLGWALITGQLLPLPNPAPASFCSQMEIPNKHPAPQLPENWLATQTGVLLVPATRLLTRVRLWLLIFLSRKRLPGMSFGHDLRATSLSPRGPSAASEACLFFLRWPSSGDYSQGVSMVRWKLLSENDLFVSLELACPTASKFEIS